MNCHKSQENAKQTRAHMNNHSSHTPPLLGANFYYTSQRYTAAGTISDWESQDSNITTPFTATPSTSGPLTKANNVRQKSQPASLRRIVIACNSLPYRSGFHVLPKLEESWVWLIAPQKSVHLPFCSQSPAQRIEPG